MPRLWRGSQYPAATGQRGASCAARQERSGRAIDSHSWSPERRARPDRSAFTLLELLLAVALSGTVLTLTARIALDALQTRRIITETVDQHQRLDFVTDSIAADLEARLTDAEQPLVIGLDANHRPRIELVCLAAEPGGALHTSLVPAAVTYRLVRVPHETLRLKLQREVQPLAGRSAGPQVTTVCDDLADFEVTLHYGSGWLPLNARTGQRKETPAAWRVHYRRLGDRNVETRTFVIGGPAREGHSK